MLNFVYIGFFGTARSKKSAFLARLAAKIGFFGTARSKKRAKLC